MALIEKIGNVSLNLDYYSGKDYYCDGETEDQCLEIVKNYDKNEYDRIIFEKGLWELMYHLSHIRENVLSWYNFDKSMSVLEIGSGCGAITGILAEKCKNVDCIELSKKRSLINAYRNKNLDNIEIIVGNFQNIEPNITKKYDVITLIGVLEYAESYINSDEPYTEFLSIIKNHLKPEGKLLIAIENKLGMKYWAGCKEDHLSRYYESIEDYSNSKGVKTFGKKELSQLIEKAGFSEYKFYYPYPDYKFTERIYSDEYLPVVGELGNSMRNFDNDRIVSFDEARAFDAIIKNDLFPYYSNSFLVEIKG